MARKSRRSRRSRRRSRRSRGGKMLSKKQMTSIKNMAMKTQKDAMAAQAKASKAMHDAQMLKSKSLATGVKSLCDNPFMKNHPKCMEKLQAAKSAAGQVATAAKGVKAKAAALEKKINNGGLAVPKVGGRRKRRRSRRKRKSRKSRRKSRRSRRRSRRHSRRRNRKH